MSKSLPQILAQTFGLIENEPGSKKLDQKLASNFLANFWAKSWSKSLPQTFWQTFGITNQHPGEQKFAPTLASNFLANVGAMSVQGEANVGAKVRPLTFAPTLVSVKQGC